tara:strand:+ start:663 stop:857 length:195 start_codon:yes stop_codon:yes gene_type:complete
MGKTNKQDTFWGKRPPYKRDKKHKLENSVKVPKESKEQDKTEVWDYLYSNEEDEEFEKFSRRKK